MNLFCDITKVNEEERMVYGYASTEALDSQGEIVTKEAIQDALSDFMKFGNIRYMHQPHVVGKAHEADVDDKGLYIGVKVGNDEAWRQVKDRELNGFSIGGKSITKSGGIISKLRLTEISLVDRPANPEAVFNIWKGDGMADEIKDEVIEEVAKSDEVVESPVEKGMYDVARLASIIADLSYLQENTEWEAEYEGDNSPIPADLKAQIKALGATLVSMAQEEVSEIVGEVEDVIEYSDKIEDISKAGASISTANKAKLQSIIDMCNEMMGDTEKSDVETDIQKGDDINKSFDNLQKAFDTQKSEMAKMSDRIKELEALPTPSKLEAAIIAKGDEDKEIAKRDEDKSSRELIREARQAVL